LGSCVGAAVAVAQIAIPACRHCICSLLPDSSIGSSPLLLLLLFRAICLHQLLKPIATKLLPRQNGGGGSGLLAAWHLSGQNGISSSSSGVVPHPTSCYRHRHRTEAKATAQLCQACDRLLLLLLSSRCYRSRKVLTHCGSSCTLGV
jgi:hypothetical protein